MLRNASERKILQACDREMRLFLALAACLTMAFDRRTGAQEAIDQACKVFARVFPEKMAEKREKTE